MQRSVFDESALDDAAPTPNAIALSSALAHANGAHPAAPLPGMLRRTATKSLCDTSNTGASADLDLRDGALHRAQMTVKLSPSGTPFDCGPCAWALGPTNFLVKLQAQIDSNHIAESTRATNDPPFTNEAKQFKNEK